MLRGIFPIYPLILDGIKKYFLARRLKKKIISKQGLAQAVKKHVMVLTTIISGIVGGSVGREGIHYLLGLREY